MDVKGQSEGLGDSLAKAFHALKIDKLADAVVALTGASGCGCDERRELLNKLFPYDHKMRKFRVIEEFKYQGQVYPKDKVFALSKRDELHNFVIQLAQQNKIEEI